MDENRSQSFILGLLLKYFLSFIKNCLSVKTVKIFLRQLVLRFVRLTPYQIP